MKLVIFSCLTLFCIDYCKAEIRGDGPAFPDPVGTLESHNLPLTEKALKALKSIILHLNCEFDQYCRMSGIIIHNGGSCIFNEREGRIELKLDRKETHTALMLVGDLMIFCENDKVTNIEILERYAFTGHPMKCWNSVKLNPDDYLNWKPQEQKAKDGQPAVAPGSQLKVMDKKIDNMPNSQPPYNHFHNKAVRIQGLAWIQASAKMDLVFLITPSAQIWLEPWTEEAAAEFLKWNGKLIEVSGVLREGELTSGSAGQEKPAKERLTYYRMSDFTIRGIDQVKDEITMKTETAPSNGDKPPN